MKRSDLPYVMLTLMFCLSIFVAGRMSAPTPEPRVVVVREPAPPAIPSVVVVTSAAPEQPPLALLPEVPSAAPSVSVAPKPVAKALPKPAPKVEATAEAVYLEETPALPVNPYKSSDPGF
jgi:hypothetical protein